MHRLVNMLLPVLLATSGEDLVAGASQEDLVER